MIKLLKPVFILGFFFFGSLSFNSHAGKSQFDLRFHSKNDTGNAYFLILTSFDLNDKKMRKNKKELFANLILELENTIQVELDKRINGKTEIIEQVIVPDTDSILKLLVEKNATNAIVIKDYDAFFYQDDVEVTKTPEGKNRVARYDICSDITYLYYNSVRLIDSTPVRVCQFYSTRTVASGLLAAGPNIVSNKKEAMNITRQNVQKYFYTFHSD